MIRAENGSKKQSLFLIAPVLIGFLRKYAIDI